MGPTVAQVLVQLSHENGVVTVETKRNPPWSIVVWGKFCVHLRSLNFHHFGTIEATGLKLQRRDHLQWYDLPTELHENLLVGSK
jgi:hypothetical protein